MFSKKDQASTGKQSKGGTYKLQSHSNPKDEELFVRDLNRIKAETDAAARADAEAKRKESNRVSKNFLNLATRGTDLNDNKFGKGYSITKRNLPPKKK